MGGEEELSTQLAGEPPLKLPFPLGRFTVQLGPKFLRVIKLGILQYLIYRPLSSLAAILCQIFGVYGEGEWSFRFAYLYLQVIGGNISFSVSFYCLFTFYLATRSILRASKPLLKFVSIKLVVFWVFWQGLLFSILAGLGALPATAWRYSSWELALVLNNAIITVEMFAIAGAKNRKCFFCLFSL